MSEAPIRVLLIEDDEDDYLLTRDLLSEMGSGKYALEWVATYDAAVEALARHRHDVYLLDYRLGQHDGLELLRRSPRNGAPVIMLTGQDDRDVDLRAMRAGATDYLVKGHINAAGLERSIRYALERKRAEESLRRTQEELERRVEERTVALRRTNQALRAEIEERKRAEEALKEADRKKDEFLATLAHELRNPLAPIRNAVQVLRLTGPPEPELCSARDMIERNLRQMVRLIDDLLDVSRITRGKLQVRRSKVELAAAVHSAVETAQPLVEAAGHQLTVSLPPEPVYLDADPLRLAQVFANLLTNAAKYTDQAGRIWITACRRGGEVVVSVKDTGIGIPAEYLPCLFEMFSQVAPALERAQGGLGIGLALVRGLVEMHGGSVEAKSDGPGQGSEFVVRLPVVTPPAPAPEQPEKDEQSGPRARLRILVVDDLHDSAESLAVMLRHMGHDTRTGYDGVEGVAVAEAFRPDVILLDIGMPKMNGYKAARRIRQQPWGKDVVIVALTGWGQDEDKRRSQEAGFSGHLVKPVEPAALEQLLSEWRSETA